MAIGPQVTERSCRKEGAARAALGNEWIDMRMGLEKQACVEAGFDLVEDGRCQRGNAIRVGEFTHCHILSGCSTRDPPCCVVEQTDVPAR
ncbi:MAG: hypothetical protein IPN40_14290 [Uliginosibacterium sp.]|nr:hypothetical protein [Uliginosibacterium sp.]